MLDDVPDDLGEGVGGGSEAGGRDFRSGGGRRNRRERDGFWNWGLAGGGGGFGRKRSEEVVTGMEARGGLGGLAGKTVAGDAWMRFSILSMSDWEDGLRVCYHRDIFTQLSRRFLSSLALTARQWWTKLRQGQTFCRR